MNMVLGYYRSRYTSPGSYRPEFERPWNRPVLPIAQADPETGETFPYEWYQYGVPMNEPSLQRLCDLTDFRPITSRPAFGSWTTQIVEQKLRQYGPFIFLGNWNRQGFHAVLVVGRRIDDPGTRHQTDSVIYIDPDSGMQLSVSLAHFNSMMSNVGMSSFNPLYYPFRPQVRATEIDRAN